ncbi:TIGR02757 family protein [Rhodothermaceae bacterium RA]|nr:TIGR02757 family protein [Rhodothermaceae bacterium RA]
MPAPLTPDLKAYLDALVRRFEQPAFIAEDPIAIPHGFDDPRDQEVIGLFAALLAWGRRQTVLDKMAELCARMAFRPYRFVYDFDEARDAPALEGFRHRTFQPIDALWLTKALSHELRTHGTVEALFARHLSAGDEHVGPAIQGFSAGVLTSLEGTPARLRKHLARPASGSACKRLAMYLRWMVRPGPVDLGIWSRIRPAQLVLPLDVHSGRQARALGLIDRAANDWKAALELTRRCRRLCPEDPARYDYAFFGAGAYGVSLDARFTGANTRTATSSPTRR